MPRCSRIRWCQLVIGAGVLLGFFDWANGVRAAGIQIEKVVANTLQELAASNQTRFGFYVFAGDCGPQLAVIPARATAIAVLPPQSSLTITSRIQRSADECVDLQVQSRASGGVIVSVYCGQEEIRARLRDESIWRVPLPRSDEPSQHFCKLILSSDNDTVPVVIGLELRSPGNVRNEASLELTPGNPQLTPPLQLPVLYPEIAFAMVEWDWRQQDGLSSNVPQGEDVKRAIAQAIHRGNLLVKDLTELGVQSDLFLQWQDLCKKWEEIQTDASISQDVCRYDSLWLQVRTVKRKIAFLNPYLKNRGLVFVKNALSIFSHQLTQYTGNCARPGGGVFVLEEPGQSMVARNITPADLPIGSYQFCDVSPEGKRILFSFCETASAPRNRESALDRFFQLYELDLESGQVRKLTDGPYDHFAGKYLADGRIVCVSTRRGGFHRCGQGPCPVHTLTLLERNGSKPKVVSFHETHEWDPVQLFDGRVLYTRWDYVDRNAVFYQQLWTVRDDGTNVQAYYGNNTFNPVGIWEGRPIPGTNAIMATAAAHHAMTAGSIIRLDIPRGIDGPAPITRLTSDALFPESEVPVINASGGRWFNPVGITAPPLSEEQKRFPGHCYRTPYPLSEKYFLVAYSYDPLIGEPDANQINMFGIYLMDIFGNKELVYRDLNISSLWPVLFPKSTRSSLVSSQVPAHPASRGIEQPNEKDRENAIASEFAPPLEQSEGVFLLANVYNAWPRLPPVKIARLRIVQVLPKSTWHANNPPLGIPNISPGKQVLGTVPVEADGSAYFLAPAGKALCFQALDEMGQAVQVMRSVTYLQPGEMVACIGCHEPRNSAPGLKHMPMALSRPPSDITPGPPGSRPLSFPLLVQPVLNRHCVQCHGEKDPGAGIKLTGAIEGRYTNSYIALSRYVPYADWAGRQGDFRLINSEPTTQPDFFGARGSQLMKILSGGHYDVHLSGEDLERLVTWMDCNVLFYGTFNVEDQKRQQRGEIIAGPDLE
ncbi:MAG: HzsA-related protein [Thermogutta sp.]